VLLTRLHGHAQCWRTRGIDGHADDAAWHQPTGKKKGRKLVDLCCLHFALCRVCMAMRSAGAPVASMGMPMMRPGISLCM
jgi:hypothetical protein